MNKTKYLQAITILVFLAFFIIVFTAYFKETNEVVKSGADVFGLIFDKLVEFFTIAQ